MRKEYAVSHLKAFIISLKKGLVQFGLNFLILLINPLYLLIIIVVSLLIFLYQ